MSNYNTRTKASDMTDDTCPLCNNPILDGDCVLSRQGLTFHAGCGEGSLAWPVVLESLHQRITALEACEEARRSPLGEPSQEMQERIRLQCDAAWKTQDKPVDAGPAAHPADDAVGPYTIEHMRRMGSDIAAKDAALAKRHLQVKEMHEELCDRAKERDELAALLRRIRSACMDTEEPCAVLPADIIKSIDAALAKVGT